MPKEAGGEAQEERELQVIVSAWAEEQEGGGDYSWDCERVSPDQRHDTAGCQS